MQRKPHQQTQQQMTFYMLLDWTLQKFGPIDNK